MHLLPRTYMFITTHTHTNTHTCAHRSCRAWSYMMTDPNSCYLSTHTHAENSGGTHVHTHTHTHTIVHTYIRVACRSVHKRAHTQSQRAQPEPSNVDSDPAIFKGHTSQDIISSSFVLRDLCLFTQHAHTHAHSRG